MILPRSQAWRRGRDGLKDAFRMFWEGTPGTHTIEDQIAEGAQLGLITPPEPPRS